MKLSFWSSFFLIFCAITMDLLVGMEFDLFVPSFPALEEIFHLSPSQVEILLSANFVGYCLGIVFVGSFSDRHGRKTSILGGLLLFVIGSLLCLAGKDYYWLLVGRFFQGLGISAPGILSFLIIADRFPLKTQQMLMGLLNASMNVAAGAAPVLGSFLTLYFGWRGNFSSLLALGVLALGMIFLSFKEPPKPPEKQKRSVIADYQTMFASQPLRILLFYIIVMIVPYWIFVGMAPLLYMQELGVSLKTFGYYQGVQAFTFGVGSLVLGLIVNKISHRKLLWTTNILHGISLIFLVVLSILSLFKIQSGLWLTAGLLIFVIGQIPTSILYTLSLNIVPEVKGLVSGFLQGAKLLLSAISLQLAAWAYDRTFLSTGTFMSVFIFLSVVSLHRILKRSDVP